MNEFYMVQFAWGAPYYFKDKDKAFNFLWQTYLNDACYDNEEEYALGMEAARKSLNENYYIDEFGGVYVLGFED